MLQPAPFRFLAHMDPIMSPNGSCGNANSEGEPTAVIQIDAPSVGFWQTAIPVGQRNGQ